MSKILATSEPSSPCSTTPALPPLSSTHPIRILAIDQGEIHFGICLAEYDGRIVTPLFLGTAYIEPKPLARLVEDRAASRRVRRTGREHRRRLKRLRDLLGGRGSPLADQPQLVQTIAAFAKRRGHFYGTGEEEDAKEVEAKGAISHQAFRHALGEFLTHLLPDPAIRDRVFRICCSILDKQSRRPMRVNARNVGVCQWADCANRRAPAGVGSLVQGVSGKLRPFLEAKVETRRVLTAETVLTVAEAVYQEPGPGPTALIRMFDEALLTGLNLTAHQDAKGRRLPPEKALDAWRPILEQPLAGETPDQAAARRLRAKLVARWLTPQPKESIRKTVQRDLESARTAARTGDTIRARFCPEHQKAFIAAFLQGERPPLREDSQDASRRLAILADKLTAYLSRRVLGARPRRVDALVVESSAFDSLRMLRRKHVKTTGGDTPRRPTMTRREEEALYTLYWEGPRAGFPDSATMLRDEFGDRCAYCGQPLGPTFEEDHVLPRARFPMDGYLVRVPAHAACNRAKGQRSIFLAGLGIHPDALQAFRAYVATKKAAHTGAIHPILEVKQGFLQNLTREAVAERLARADGDVERAERGLREMAGSWMLHTTASARHGRFLKHALATRLDIPRGAVHAISPRHAALLRAQLTGAFDYDKAVAKAAGDRVDNHALDAYVLALGMATGCFATMAEAERFRRDTEDALADAVASADPTFRTLHRFNLDLLPVPGIETVSPGFGVMGGTKAGASPDDSLGVPLGSITPPSRKQSRFDTTLYALTGPQRDEAARRVAVAKFWGDLQGEQGKGRTRIEQLTYLQLRGRLLAAWDAGGLARLGQELVRWYQATARGFDRPGPTAAHTGHPTIQRRWEAIRAFLAKPDATVADIPADFSLRLKQEGRGDPTPLVRGPHQHQRLAAGGVVAKIVGYRRGETGQPDRTHPVVLSVQPDWCILVDKKGGYRDLPALPPDLAAPLAHDGTPFRPRCRQKQAALIAWLRAAGCVEQHWVRAGSTVRKRDGSRLFVASHKAPPPQRYTDIAGVTRGLPAA
jgi:hypothetical protein